MTFNTGFLCLNCGSRRVYASLLGRHYLRVILRCGGCGQNEDNSVDLLGDLFDYRKKSELDPKVNIENGPE